MAIAEPQHCGEDQPQTRAQITKSDIAIAVSASEQTKLEDQRASLDLEALPAESSPTDSRKRNASIAGLDDDSLNVESPDNDQLGDDASGKKRPIKRACNECRQQKLRCDVVQEPFKICTRCRRLRLECKIEDNFKRIGKRSRNAEMEREIVELRRRVAEQDKILQTNGAQQVNGNLSIPNHAYAADAAAGLLDLRSGLDKSPGRAGATYKRLETVVLTVDRARALHQRFFTFFHPFLPFLNPDRSPEDYYTRSPLLFWTIMHSELDTTRPMKSSFLP
ncbi:uncharacterized protein AB675_3637 [Cyphellophora attinorum]|uniref:Zn(2)-C6 fungal-type domain-containing protein n=1 Tax=Cyphellophora attinorum TaxID=1664694 RepID=A0A0N0NJK8_9EURO|nr:uncharacterized protein AB675_3637 [Phialophora attinorum]KPI37081.1 hypothetical protein AB675_3637 [Phialophora attinorum]